MPILHYISVYLQLRPVIHRVIALSARTVKIDRCRSSRCRIYLNPQATRLVARNRGNIVYTIIMAYT